MAADEGTRGDRQLLVRATFAVVLASIRYRLTLARLVRAQLAGWQGWAQAIDDPELRALALEKLHRESFNAEAAAMLATAAPRSQRATVAKAIVALEVLFDYLDGRNELPSPEPLIEGSRMFRAFTDAVALGTEPGNSDAPIGADGRYLAELGRTVRTALKALPSSDAVAEALKSNVGRGAEVQVRAHAAATVGSGQLEDWARSAADREGLRWREFMVGAAASVLGAHALILAAADPRTTGREATDIDGLYMDICGLATMLDGLIDHDQDVSSSGVGYLRFFGKPSLLEDTLLTLSQRAIGTARNLPNGVHHVMVVCGVLGYYLSAPESRGGFAKPLADRLQLEFGTLIAPTLWLMRLWRRVKESGDRAGRHRGSAPSGPADERRGPGPRGAVCRRRPGAR